LSVFGLQLQNGGSPKGRCGTISDCTNLLLQSCYMTDQRSTGTPETTGKEWMSLAYMRVICAQAGLNIKKCEFDNGIDLDIGSCKPTEQNSIANAFIAVQLKSTENWQVENNNFIKYDLPIKNYNQLRLNNSLVPQYLVLFTLPPQTSHWVTYKFEYTEHKHVVEIRHMAYYFSLKGEPETENTTTIRVQIPINNKLTAEVLTDLYQQVANPSWATNQRGQG
jgi:hypothetical protein